MRSLSFTTLTIVLFSFFLVACNEVRKESEAAKLIGNTSYLKVNMWFEHPLKIQSTNYHKGAMLRAGDEVTVLKIGRGKIRFRDRHGMDFTLYLNRKHTFSSISKLAERTFSRSDIKAPGGAFDRMSAMEKENIRKGKVAIGMSKKAVIMAYGYPPEHRTYSLDSDLWIYWRSRFIKRRATFENGRVVAFR